ncbi:MAG TPA: hypothetical protein VG992_00470 [Candidatus Saccharimonadales bacterium]|nr:hypothetical protein [Candidatus Saccharimonadales bacterium]
MTTTGGERFILDAIDDVDLYAGRAAMKLMQSQVLVEDYRLSVHELVDALTDLPGEALLNVSIQDTAQMPTHSLEQTVERLAGHSTRDHTNTATIFSFPRRNIKFELDSRDHRANQSAMYVCLFLVDEKEVQAHLVDLPIGHPQIKLSASEPAKV